MSDWELPERIELFRDRTAELIAAMKALAEASRRAAEATRAAAVPVTLEGLGLQDWDDEMDNCYPDWSS